MIKGLVLIALVLIGNVAVIYNTSKLAVKNNLCTCRIRVPAIFMNMIFYYLATLVLIKPEQAFSTEYMFIMGFMAMNLIGSIAINFNEIISGVIYCLSIIYVFLITIMFYNINYMLTILCTTGVGIYIFIRYKNTSLDLGQKIYTIFYLLLYFIAFLLLPKDNIMLFIGFGLIGANELSNMEDHARFKEDDKLIKLEYTHSVIYSYAFMAFALSPLLM